MLKLNPQTYGDVIKRCYKTKDPLFVGGPPGIGKSEIPRQVFKQIAKDKGLEFVIWNNTNKEEKGKLFENPEKYFVLCDQRLSQMDTTDLRGIPKLTGDTLEPLPPAWIVYFCKPKSDGVIFFDEINLATPIVVGSAYQIINDRSMSDMKLSDNVLLIAAGNRAEDKAYTFDMPLPLRDRFCEAELTADVDSWTNWAAGSKVNPHLIAFVNWKESYLYRVSENGTDKSTTPRGIARASRLLKGLDITSGEANMFVSISVGEAFATEFQAYVKYFKELNWKTIFATPEIVSDFEVSKLFAVTGGLAEKFLKDYKMFDKAIEVVKHVPEEFAVMTLRLMRDGDRASFKRRAKASQTFIDDVAPRLGKFIIEVE
jgi:hypothetical protein